MSDLDPMENKSVSASAALALARLKAKPVKVQRRVPVGSPDSEGARRSRRQSACLQALIQSDRLAEPVHCVIRDLSAIGARLEIVKQDTKPFVSEERLPDQFTLAFRLEKTEVDCEIVWQKGNTLGVTFKSLPRHA